MFDNGQDLLKPDTQKVVVKKISSGRHKGKWTVEAPGLPSGTLRKKKTAMKRAKAAKAKLEGDPLYADDIEIKVKN